MTTYFQRIPRLFGNAEVDPRRPDVNLYRDAYLEGWALYDRRDRLIPHSAYYRGVPSYRVVDNAPVSRSLGRHGSRTTGHALAFWIGPMHTHFGHFLVSTLSRLWAYREAHATAGMRLAYVGGQPPHELAKIEHVRLCFEALDVKFENLVQVGGNVCFDEIVVAEPSFIENYSVYTTHLDLFRVIRDYVRVATPGGLPSSSPVYVSKELVKGGVRTIANENLVTERLSTAGVRVVHPQLMSFPEQVALWNENENFLGFASSAFHLAAFATGRYSCAISFDAQAWSNQVLLDRLAGNETLHVVPSGGFEQFGRTATFSDAIGIKNPERFATEVLRIMDRMQSGRRIPAQKFSPTSLWDERVVDEPFGTEIARGRTATQSSTYALAPAESAHAAGAVSGKLTGGFQSHTELDELPWWQVDLGEVHHLYEIRIFNRLDHPIARQRLQGLELLLSAEGSEWQLASAMTGITDPVSPRAPHRWKAPPGIVARRVRLQLPRKDYLHFDQVEIFGEPVAMMA